MQLKIAVYYENCCCCCCCISALEKKKKSQALSIIRQQEAMIKGMEKAIDENQKKGELIYEHYTELESILKELNKAKEKYSWKEIKEKLKVHDVIKDLDEKDKKIVVDL